jgi:hypothetical protein
MTIGSSDQRTSAGGKGTRLSGEAFANFCGPKCRSESLIRRQLDDRLELLQVTTRSPIASTWSLVFDGHCGLNTDPVTVIVAEGDDYRDA